MAHLWLTAFALDRRSLPAAASDDGRVINTYDITPSTTNINETDNRLLTYTVTTQGVDNGTTLYWINDPVEGGDGASDPSDASPTLTQGTVVVNGGEYNSDPELAWIATGTISFYISNDFSTEVQQEEIRLLLKTGSASGPTVATAAKVWIEDTSKNPWITVGSNVNTIQEPGNVVFTITSHGFSEGTVVSWSNTGTTTAADFTQNVNSGSVEIGADGTATVTLTVRDEDVIEPNETIVFNITANDVFGALKTASTTVTVTNAPASYSITPSATTIYEGQQVTYEIITTDLPNGTQLYWTNEGTSESHDFTQNISQGIVTINNNYGSITLNTRINQVEASETIILKLKTISFTAGTVATAQTVTILDSVMTITPDKTSMNEGDSITFSIVGPSEPTQGFQGIPNGTAIFWDIDIASDGAVAAHDFFEGSNGVAYLNNNQTSVVLNSKFNGVESTEYLNFRIYDDVARTSLIGVYEDIPINNASVSITRNKTTINEGQSVTFTVNTTNISDGISLLWENIGTSNQSDFVEAVDSGTFTITDNVGTITLTAVEDLTTEGAESIIIRVKPANAEDVILATSDSVVIADTSLDPPPTYEVSANKTEVNEGSSVLYTITTERVDDNTILYWSLSGVTSADIQGSETTGEFLIESNSGEVTIWLQNDLNTEGAETMTFEVRTGSVEGPIVATVDVGVIDTSTFIDLYFTNVFIVNLDGGSAPTAASREYVIEPAGLEPTVDAVPSALADQGVYAFISGSTLQIGVTTPAEPGSDALGTITIRHPQNAGVIATLDVSYTAPSTGGGGGSLPGDKGGGGGFQ